MTLREFLNSSINIRSEIWIDCYHRYNHIFASKKLALMYIEDEILDMKIQYIEVMNREYIYIEVDTTDPESDDA